MSAQVLTESGEMRATPDFMAVAMAQELRPEQPVQVFAQEEGAGAAVHGASAPARAASNRCRHYLHLCVRHAAFWFKLRACTSRFQHMG